MSKVRTTLTIDEDVFEGSQGPGGRTGRGDGEVTEEALRRELGLDLEELWEQAGLSEDEAAALAVEAQHATRRRR